MIISELSIFFSEPVFSNMKKGSKKHGRIAKLLVPKFYPQLQPQQFCYVPEAILQANNSCTNQARNEKKRDMMYRRQIQIEKKNEAQNIISEEKLKSIVDENASKKPPLGISLFSIPENYVPKDFSIIKRGKMPSIRFINGEVVVV